jgi:excisionase family DNA binding protein
LLCLLRLVYAAVVTRSDDWLTTGQAALIIGSTRQHVVDLCNRGLLPYTLVNRHRRIKRADLEGFSAGSRGMTRDQQRSFRLAMAVAGHLVTDPEGTKAAARAHLESLSSGSSRRRGGKWRDKWVALLDGPLDDLLSALTADTVASRELRQNSPFIGILSDEERDAVLRNLPRPAKVDV